MSRVMLWTIVVTHLAAFPADAREPKPEELTWIKDHAIVLETAEAGRGFDDLSPLKALIGDARIVSLGEGTHGTREFFQMKHRLVEFLAGEMGFSIFAIEANMPEAYRLNDYVLNGKGDPEELIAGMYFWTWNTREVLDLVMWMREFNKAGKGRIEFTGFDAQTPDVAMQIVQEAVDRVEPKYAKKVAETYAAAKQAGGGGANFGVATGTFPIEGVAGKRIRFSGYIKTDGITRDSAGLWWRVDGKSGVLGFDNMHGGGPKGTTDWKRYEITMDVDPKVTNINFGALHSGDGVAWFDQLKVEIDGQPFASENLFDFDFESGEAKGFLTGGAGYEVTVDSDTAHSGKRSLRMKCVADEKDAERQAKKAAETTGKVVEHIAAARDRYLKKMPEREFEWMLQNARVVHQCYLSSSGAVSRDESMAANVAWILKQAPKGTKIVLWAHNAHVRLDGGGYSSKPMGAHLHEMYPGEMVVFGFACHTGRYRAVKKKEGLQANDLQPAEPGSAEYYFHKTGLPRFILDLSKVSDDTPSSAWLADTIDFRSIGALAMEEQFSSINLPEAFDALIYIDKTTPSQSLGR